MGKELKIAISENGDTNFSVSEMTHYEVIGVCEAIRVNTLMKMKKSADETDLDKRKMFDEFYAWLDAMTIQESDELSLTEKIETFFFEKSV
jgi:hypothetical protein